MKLCEFTTGKRCDCAKCGLRAIFPVDEKCPDARDVEEASDKIAELTHAAETALKTLNHMSACLDA